ncbi:MAG: protein translocase subunit SecF [Dongiaceae bacterium]
MFHGLHVIPPETRIDFMRYHGIGFVFSSILLIAAIILIPLKGLNFGVDFAGGILIEASASEPVDIANVRAQLSDLGLGEVALQGFGEPNKIAIRLQHQEYGEQDRLAAIERLRQERRDVPADELERLSYGRADQEAQQRAIEVVRSTLGPEYKFDRTEFVGPKVGRELIEKGILATVLALLGIMAYVWFRYEWQFGVNCIIAMFYDCITVVGLFSLFGWQFDLNVLAAILTIAGFSVNDKVVVYDRIREELRRYKKMPLAELLNMSINRTLSRTIMTSGLAFLSVVAILLFGGDVLRGFAIAMTWGIVKATYSTICVATPMLIYMNLRREKVGSYKPDAEKAASRP